MSGASDMPPRRLAFALGDYLGGGVLGAATAVGVRAFVDPTWDVALAMLVGTGIGMICHLAVGLVLSPALGFFHVMVPASLIGMYGGMLFGMRDAMQLVTLSHALVVGATFGTIVTAIVQFYDLALSVGGRGLAGHAARTATSSADLRRADR